jgi:hypothetical protein
LDIFTPADVLYGRHMDRRLKPIDFPDHARRQMRERGATVEEVVDAIRTSSWRPARGGRLQCHKRLPYRQRWRGRYYRAKRLRVLFVETSEMITVVTVITYYF